MDRQAKAVRQAAANFPSARDNKDSFLRFINVAEMEHLSQANNFQGNNALEELFVRCLLQKLEGKLYQAVSATTPATFADFRRALLRSTNHIRPIAVIESEAKTYLQRPNESALGRLEALRKEFGFAIKLRTPTQAEVARLLAQLDADVLIWAPNAITDQMLGLQCRQAQLNSLQRMKEFIELERDRLATVRFHESKILRPRDRRKLKLQKTCREHQQKN